LHAGTWALIEVCTTLLTQALATIATDVDEWQRQYKLGNDILTELYLPAEIARFLAKPLGLQMLIFNFGRGRHIVAVQVKVYIICHGAKTAGTGCSDAALDIHPYMDILLMPDPFIKDPEGLGNLEVLICEDLRHDPGLHPEVLLNARLPDGIRDELNINNTLYLIHNSRTCYYFIRLVLSSRQRMLY